MPASGLDSGRCIERQIAGSIGFATALGKAPSVLGSLRQSGVFEDGQFLDVGGTSTVPDFDGSGRLS